ncbi:GNAT family N-acetyltransferase [Erythrobacter sp. YT30]|uniref:GNAT family N-acetyltransferase n=1 Tax=Erythrobacter sp. YT30 TaxID=1735012 RepID=UPI00076D9BC2|nr:GNAT family N-acetyltransferase [Erythrobacter sp. YT30]KWV91392.1 acetyltransferase [Erythrobacter sp. YT30]
MREIILQTRRLDLCKIGEGDLDAHFEGLNTPATMERLGGVKTREELAEKHEKTRQAWEADGFGFMLGWERSTGELVANCGVKRVDNPNASNQGDHEIGWLVRETKWRQGFAEEAMRSVIDWAIDEIGAPYLVALTSERNVGSWKLMEKLGMERRPDLDFTDPAFDPEDNPTIQYSLTPSQWEQHK